MVMSPHRGQSSDTKAQDRVEELLGMLKQLVALDTRLEEPGH